MPEQPQPRSEGGKQDLPADLADLKPENLNSIAENCARNLEDLKTHQIRRIFGALDRVRSRMRGREFSDEDRRSLVLLIPLMAYAAGRDRKVKPLYELLSQGIERSVNDSRDNKLAVDNLFNLAQAVVAYHKFHEKGGDN